MSAKNKTRRECSHLHSSPLDTSSSSSSFQLKSHKGFLEDKARQDMNNCTTCCSVFGQMRAGVDYFLKMTAFM